jgi:hypothetical protein
MRWLARRPSANAGSPQADLVDVSARGAVHGPGTPSSRCPAMIRAPDSRATVQNALTRSARMSVTLCSERRASTSPAVRSRAVALAAGGFPGVSSTRGWSCAQDHPPCRVT